MNTSGSGRSDAWMILIPLAAILVISSFANGGTAGLMSTLDGLVRGTLRTVTAIVSSLF